MSDSTLERIEHELQLMNINMGEANDIAMLATFSSMPANLDTESRKALGQLRDKMMRRAIARADL